MSNCKFFFSYARNDKSEYLNDFFERLREDVMHKTGTKLAKEAAFRDSDDIDIGTRWTDELVYALQTSSVLVCIYSPSYFSSEYCGKEVYAFQSRIAEYKKGKTEAPSVILPILWETPSTISIPASLRTIQYSHGNIHEDYPVKGLLTLSKLSKYKDAYLEFIELLAVKIREASEKINLPTSKFDDITSIPSAFNVVDIKTKETVSNVSPTPKQTRLVFAVGDKNELGAIKIQTEGYSDKSEYWKPFYPEEHEIGIVSQQIVSEKLLHYFPIQFSDDLVEIIREAEDNNSIVIMIVDPWSTRLDKYSKPIGRFDKERFINCAVVIVWNGIDEETTQNQEKLRTNLDKSLYHCMLENVAGVKDDIKTASELKNSMSIAIDEARAKLLKRAKYFQTIDAEKTSVPMLSVSGRS